mmetsp:Transcript_14443/g.12253  ORF Transcript_14443/g.12253 Transcript_14443/m.12253 type:complete len:86 (+) Transcript_14443:538-795(+)
MPWLFGQFFVFDNSQVDDKNNTQRVVNIYNAYTAPLVFDGHPISWGIIIGVLLGVVACIVIILVIRSRKSRDEEATSEYAQMVQN